MKTFVLSILASSFLVGAAFAQNTGNGPGNNAFASGSASILYAKCSGEIGALPEYGVEGEKADFHLYVSAKAYCENFASPSVGLVHSFLSSGIDKDSIIFNVEVSRKGDTVLATTDSFGGYTDIKTELAITGKEASYKATVDLPEEWRELGMDETMEDKLTCELPVHEFNCDEI